MFLLKALRFHARRLVHLPVQVWTVLRELFSIKLDVVQFVHLNFEEVSCLIKS